MNEVQKHYVVNGAHFIASFLSEAELAAYVPPEGAIEVSARPSPDHQWVEGEWAYVEPYVAPPEPEPLTPAEKLAAAGLTVEDLKALLKE